MFYGEDQLATPFEFEVGWENARITGVFGSEEVIATNNGLLSLRITDSPLYIGSGTKKPAWHDHTGELNG